jgi:hypothetical protein
MKRLLLLATLAACGPKPVVTPPHVADDSKVTEGSGWSRVEPGTWAFSLVEDGEQPQLTLNAEPGGRGTEKVELPAGATGGTVSAIEVIYMTPGAGAWTIGATTQSVSIGEDQIGGWVSTPLSAPVSGAFDVVFESPDGMLSVGALNEDRDAQVTYQPPGETAQPAPFTPFLHVTLTDVH